MRMMELGTQGEAGTCGSLGVGGGAGVAESMLLLLPGSPGAALPDAKQSRSRTHRTIPERWEHPNVHQPVSG